MVCVQGADGKPCDLWEAKMRKWSKPVMIEKSCGCEVSSYAEAKM